MSFSHIPFLSFLILIPLLGTIFLYYMPRNVDRSNILHVSFLTSGSTLGVATLVAGLFKHGSSTFQFIDTMRFGEGPWGAYEVGVDQLSLFFVLAITLIYPLVVYAAYVMIKKNLRRFMILLFYVQSLLLGACVSLNVHLLFLFSELLGVPLFFLLGIWGEKHLMADAYRGICLWGMGSVFFLMGIVGLPPQAGSFNMPTWGQDIGGATALFWIGSFFIKLPLLPLGRWWERMVIMANPLMSGLIMGGVVSVSFYGIARLLSPSHFTFNTTVLMVIEGWMCLLLFLAFVRMWRSPLLKQKIIYVYVFQIILVCAGLFYVSREVRPFFLAWTIVQVPMAFFMFVALGFLHERLNSDMIADFHGLYQVMPRLSNILLLTFIFSTFYPIFLLGPTFVKGWGVPSLFHCGGGMAFMGLGALGIQLLRVHAALCLGPVTSTTVWGMKDVRREEWRLLCMAFVSVGLFVGWGFIRPSLLEIGCFSLLPHEWGL